MIILHLVQDEKFIDFFSKLIASVSDCQHRYIVHVKDPDKPFQHIHLAKPFRVVGDEYFYSETMLKDLVSCDVLVVHFLTEFGAKMIRKAPEYVKIVWSGWGADYYYLLSLNEKYLFGPETFEILKKVDGRRVDKNPLTFFRIKLRPLRKRYVRWAKLMPAIKKVDFFSAPLSDDYDLLKEALGKTFSAQYIQINYGDVESTFASDCKNIEQSDILVGNSAHATNNHIEIFRLLKRHGLNGRKVIVPLSYGDYNYRSVILDYGYELLGAHFYPILDFLPIDEYVNVISGCSCVIMNHYRQQALGNIGAALFCGAKVFLNSKNVSKNFLIRHGAHLFDVEQLNDTLTGVLNGLDQRQKMDNIRALNNVWGHRKVTDNYCNFIKKLK